MSTESESDGQETALGNGEESRQVDSGEPVSVDQQFDEALAIERPEGFRMALDFDFTGITGLVTGLGAATTAASVVAKARIEARAEVRKAEIEAETRQLEITEETKREQMRLQASRLASEPVEED